MKFTAEKNQLAELLGAASQIAERKSSIPMLSHVLLDLRGDKLTITGTDFDVRASAWGSVSGDEDGQIALPAQDLLGIVKAVAEGAQIEIKPEDAGRYRVASGRSRFILPALPGADFPVWGGATEDKTDFTVSSEAFKRIVKMALPFASTEETKFYLNGIFMHAPKGKLRGVATDGHRLARIDIEAPEGADAMPGIILPRKSAQILFKLIHGDVACSISVNGAAFRWGNVEFQTKLIDGTFPDYERVIPEPGPILIQAEAKAMRAVISRAALILKGKSSAIKIAMGAGPEATISSADQNGAASEETLTLTKFEGDISIGFNERYLSQILDAAGEGDVRINCSTGEAPTIIRPTEDEGALFILMPMRV